MGAAHVGQTNVVAELLKAGANLNLENSVCKCRYMYMYATIRNLYHNCIYRLSSVCVHSVGKLSINGGCQGW